MLAQPPKKFLEIIRGVYYRFYAAKEHTSHIDMFLYCYDPKCTDCEAQSEALDWIEQGLTSPPT